jgi:E3 ubiquitin-protein ligase listerin
MASFGKPRLSSGVGSSPAGRNPAFGGFSSPSSSLSYVAEPPDLSGISEANVAVSFKNLQKKDATTKAKALEDLVAHAQANPHEPHGGVEDAILDAWVRGPEYCRACALRR